MKYLIKADINKLLSKKFLFLLFGLIIFSLEEIIAGRLSSKQMVLYILTEHYYLTYFMIPVFMLIVYGSLEEDREYVLIRVGSYWNYFKSKLATYSIFSFVFVIAQVIVIFIMSINLKNDNSFVVPDNVSYELISYYSKYFDSITQAIFVASLYMIIGLFVLSILFFTINHFFDKKISSKIIIAAYIFMNLGLKIDKMNNLPIIFMDNYIIFHRNFNYDFKIFINILTMIIVFAVVCVLNKMYWNKKIKFNIKNIRFNDYYKNILFTKKNVFILIGVLVLMSMFSLMKSSGDFISLNDYFINIFLGHPVNSVRIIEFIEMLVLNLAPIYILSVFLEKESNDRSLFVNIRFKKASRWLNFILKNSILFILFYVVLHIMIPIVIGLLMDMEVTSGFIDLLGRIFIVKFLDLSLQFLVLLLIYCYSKNITLAFLSLLAINSLCFLPFKWILYLPFGISSLSRLKYIVGDYGLPFNIIIALLLTFILLIFTWIKNYAYKKILVD